MSLHCHGHESLIKQFVIFELFKRVKIFTTASSLYNFAVNARTHGLLNIKQILNPFFIGSSSGK